MPTAHLLAAALLLTVASPALGSDAATPPGGQPSGVPGAAAAASAAATAPATAPDTAGAAPSRAGAPFTPGEAMEFVIELAGIKAGVAKLWVGQREGALLPVNLESRSAGLAAIVSLRQTLVSRLDVATGLPVSSVLEGIEPSYRHTDTATFDRVANQAVVREVGRFDKTYTIDVPPGTLDFVALVFRLRTLPLAPGSSQEFQVLAGRTVAKVVAQVEGRETVETRIGDIPAIKVRVPTGLTGKFSEKSPTYVWFSDDARRRVVRISTNFGFGRAVAILSAYGPGQEPAAPAPPPAAP